MKRFAALFSALDATTKTTAKTAALARYFREAPERDRIWTIALLSGRRPKRIASSGDLRNWAAEATGLPVWLLEESHGIAGDLAEMIALVLPPPAARSEDRLSDWIERLGALAGEPEAARCRAVLEAWDRLDPLERLVFNKLLTGGFRMGVSRGLMTQALAAATGMEPARLAHRLMGNWSPATMRFADLVSQDGAADAARPYPFALASGLEGGPESLGSPGEWIAEWKWDGIRGQMIRRPGVFALWSRGEELMTDRFPEFVQLARHLPEGCVLDGEVLAWDGTGPLPFAALQKRIGRKTVPKALLAEAPARFLAYDLLERDGRDLRDAPLSVRRAALNGLLAALPPDLPIGLSESVAAESWDDLATARASARERLAEGLMLKRAASPYHAGRKRGDWWKWKLDPFTVDAVMIYAQAGHGRRANLFTDFTFALHDGAELVPFAKAYSGLTDAEFREITAWVRRNTLERFGPVRRVPPELVFEIAFEGIQASPRHKSGIALRFPRMLRWRRDKPAGEIDRMDTLRGLLAAERGGQPPHPRGI
ncbi:MAG: ATP-dependent DNA ligase [Pseudorhodobacter sp.]